MSELWLGIKMGGAVSGSMVAAANIDGGNISVTAAVGVCVSVAGMTWWLSSRFQKIDDRLTSIETRLTSLPCDKKECK